MAYSTEIEKKFQARGFSGEVEKSGVHVEKVEEKKNGFSCYKCDSRYMEPATGVWLALDLE